MIEKTHTHINWRRQNARDENRNEMKKGNVSRLISVKFVSVCVFEIEATAKLIKKEEANVLQQNDYG